MIKVFDNVLSLEQHETIFNLTSSQEFPWFYLDSKVGKSYGSDELNDYQFTHMFYFDYKPKSNFIGILEPLLEILNPLAIIKIKANMTLASPTIKEFPMHTDVEGFTGGVTAIYYINSNDGYTVFETGDKIDSVANRLVVFNSTIKHAGSTHTNTKYRSVINFNLYSQSI